MRWAWELIGAVPREEWDGLRLPEDEAEWVSYSGRYTQLIRGIREALPNLMEELIDLVKDLPASDVADHLVVCRGDEVLLSAYDFGEDEAWLNPGLHAEQMRRLKEVIEGGK